MRILHLTPYYAPAYAFGGVVRSVEGMATALTERGHQVTVLTTDAFDQQRRFMGLSDEVIAGVRVLRRPNVSPWLRGRFNLSTPRSMQKTAESLLPEVDILHIHEFRTLENLLVTPVAQALGLPIVLSPHGSLNLSTGRGRFKSVWDRLLSASVAQRIDHVLALTEAERAECESLWAKFGQRQRPTTFSVNPNGVSLDEAETAQTAADFRARFDLRDGPIVLYLGRLQARKGLDVLVRAFRTIQLREARLLIAGPDEGMLPTLKALAKNDQRIVFSGYLDSAARLGALSASDIFALPATGEGQSMAVLEALAAGMPVVLSPGCNMDEVADWDAGYVVEPSADAFAAKLQALLDDGGLRREMGANARRLVAEKYSWENVAGEMERVYAGLI